MSQRTLFEINHDVAHAIEANPDEFLLRLGQYLASGSPRCAEPLKHFGVTVIARRHHSDDPLMTTALDKLREQLDWRGPTGKPAGHVAFSRDHAVALAAAFGIHGEQGG